MSFLDARGNPCSSSQAKARDAVERALWRMMSFYDTPLEDLAQAEQHDPSWVLPHVMQAGFFLSLTEESLVGQAQTALQKAEALQAHATARERQHIQALNALIQGRWLQAARHWDELLLEYPRDALALQWAHLWDFYRGDASALRLRPARVLPEWDETDSLYPHVLSLHAFGLEECNLYPQAEDTARRALALDARLPWAVHAVAHVLDMQGRFEEGSAWLRLHQPAWAEGNGFAPHLWWHKALFRLEALDTEGALRLHDSHLSGSHLQITLNHLDAASLLWRLRLLGEDVTARFCTLLQTWSPNPQSAGSYAFNDVHIVIALLGAGQLHRAENWLARCAQAALSPVDAARHNHCMLKEVGVPLMRALITLEKGDADTAADTLSTTRAVWSRLGGSHAQRDLFELSTLAAAARGSRWSLGRALLNERRMHKPETPLTRHWMSSLRLDPRSRA
jgi:tetratricopeptide (TPR) repeat protein